jgi:Reverse transcriptase (RNA-dependent DNA polymerase)
MLSRTRTITRRAFLSGPTALAFAGALPAPARAFGSISSDAETAAIAKAAVLSARYCARDGFSRIPWLPRLLESDLMFKDPGLIRDIAVRTANVVGRGSFDARDFTRLDLVTAPKKAHGELRVFAVMEPLDAITYLTLALLAAPAIEANRTPSREEVVHSFRYLPRADQLFDERYNFASFLTSAAERAAEDAYVVTCDLANCYGSIGPERVEQALQDCGVAQWQTNYICELLCFWRQTKSAGLPVGSNGSSILAEAVLSRVDYDLIRDKVDFVRYVDDFRLFAADEASARLALEAVRGAASSQGVSLNDAKTSIVRFVSGRGNDLPSYTVQSEIREHQIARAGTGKSTKRYSDVLPLNFRRASAKEIESIRGAKVRPDAVVFLEGDPAPASKLRRAIRRAIYASYSEFVLALPAILVRYPEFSSYVASALAQTSDFVPGDVREQLRHEFSAMLLDESTPDFVAMKLLNVLAHPSYRARDVLEQFAEVRAADPRGMCFRLSLDALRNTGGVPPSLYGHFGKMDGWARRALLADPKARVAIGRAVSVIDPLTAKLVS